MSRRKRSKAFLLSFIITIAILSGLFAYFYATSVGPQNSPLLDDIPNYDTLWGKYTPSSVLSVSFENLTMLHSINSSLPPERVLFEVASPRITLNTSEIKSLVSIVFESPNATIDLAFVGKATFQRFSQDLAEEGRDPVNVGDSTLYPVRVNPEANPQLGWIAVIPGDSAIAFSVGRGEAKTAITESLSVLYGDSPSILSRKDVNQMLYIAGVGTNHLGIQIQNFPGVVRTGEMTLVSVDAFGDYAQVSFIVKFGDSQTASAQYDAVKSAYLSARQFTIFDNYVRAVEYQPISDVEGAIRLVG